MKVGQTGINFRPISASAYSYNDLHTQPVPCCLYPISFGLRPTPNHASWPLTKSVAYDLLSLTALLRRTSADFTVTSTPFFQLIPSLYWPVYHPLYDNDSYIVHFTFLHTTHPSCRLLVSSSAQSPTWFNRKHKMLPSPNPPLFHFFLMTWQPCKPFLLATSLLAPRL